MNPLHDTLPLHLGLMMMRTFGLNGALPFWNASSMNSGNPLDPMHMANPLHPLNLLNALQPPQQQNPFILHPLKAWAWQLEREAKHAARMRKRTKQEKAHATQEPQSDGQEHTAFTDLLSQVIHTEAFTRAQSFLAGLNAVASSQYQRTPTTASILWHRGSAQLLDYAPEAKEAVAILLIPSLINRYYILDLTPESSLILYLKSAGFRPVVVDWGEPSALEQSFNCADYISALALDAAIFLREQHDGPMALLGYCMGGIFAVAMAQLAPKLFDALILLATPWDFLSADSTRVVLNASAGLCLKQWFMHMNPVPQPVVNTLFHLIDPFAIQRRYSKFQALSEEEKAHFLAVEHWLNDGTPLSNKVACEAFVDWSCHNILHEGKWKIGRNWIEPEAIRIASLCVIPENDRIVAKGSAKALAERLAKNTVLEPPLGHVSMIVSPKAKTLVWQPLVKWLNAHF